MKSASSPRFPSGFTLVEVVLAIGILAFVVAVVIGLFSQLYRSGDQVNDMRAAIGAANSLRSHLQDETEFSTVYGWATDGSVEMVFASFLADDNGDPNVDTEGQVLGKWYSDWQTESAAVEAARQGRWLKGVLRPHPTANPVTTLPELASYPHPYLVFDVEIFVVADPDLTPTGRPVLNTAVAVQR